MINNSFSDFKGGFCVVQLYYERRTLSVMDHFCLLDNKIPLTGRHQIQGYWYLGRIYVQAIPRNVM